MMIKTLYHGVNTPHGGLRTPPMLYRPYGAYHISKLLTLNSKLSLSLLLFIELVEDLS